MKKQLPGWAVLLIITLAAGLALGGTYALTKEPIAQQALASAENARKAALPDADSFEELALNEDAAVDWAYAGLKEGATVGYVAQKTVNGFGGKVEVIAGVDTKNAPDTFTVSGISVGGSNFSETAGLGARSKEPAFTNQFAGKVYQLKLIKAGDEAGDNTIDALTSATITSTAVVNGVNDIVKYIKGDVMGIAGVEMPAKPASGVYSASAQGFRGPVYVEAAFDGANTVTYISVGDDSFAEDIGAGAVEPEFMIQFIGKTAPVTLDDVDALSGATITTKAVISALNDAATLAGGGELPVAAEIVMPEKPADGVFSASEQGFAGPVYVEAAFDEAGKITYISVGDDSFAETAGFGARALEAESQYPFIGAQLPLEIGDVDTLTGATFTKTAIVNGLNKAYAASKGEVIEEPVKEEAKMPEKPDDGVFSASEQGFAGPVYVEAAFDESGKITYISVGDDSFAETAGFGARALEAESQYPFIGAQLPLEIGDVDTLTGATFTKTAIVNSLNKAYAASKGEVTEEPVKEEAVMPEKPAVTFGAAEMGFESDVYVEAAFEDGKVAWMSIGDKRFAETEGLGAKALDPAFALQFLGKSVPLAVEDIDAITGATYTTKAVVSALNKAYGKYQEAAAAPVEEPAKPEITYTASAQGFGGPVAVEAAFEDGKIAWVAIGDASFAETPGLGAKAQEEAFQSQLIGKAMPLSLSDIDAIAGATVTSTAVVEALNAAYAQVSPAAEPEPTAEPTPAEPEAVGIIGGADGPTVLVLSGTETEGYGESVFAFFTAVQVKAEVENGKLVALSVLDKPVGSDDLRPSAQEEAMQAKFIGASLPLDTKQDTAYASAVAIAVNQAAGLKAPADENRNDESEAPVSDGALSGEVFSFFTAIQVKAQAENGVLTGLSVLDKPVGSEAWEPSAQEKAMQARFIGASLPLDTKQDTAYASAVAVAVNQAVQADGENKDQTLGYGKSIMFFTKYYAVAGFEDGKLSDFRVFAEPVGSPLPIDEAMVDVSALSDALVGREMPLSAADCAVGGVPEYLVTAVVLALNDAYENPVAAFPLM